MRELTVPISEEAIRDLTVGDPVRLNGVIATGRDTAHKYMIENFVKTGGQPPAAEADTYAALREVLAGGVIYHCGPVVPEDGRALGVRGGRADHQHPRGTVPGRGHRAFRAAGGHRQGRHGAENAGRVPGIRRVYLHAIGGAASLIAQSVNEVLTVYKPEFGVPEAFWIIRVQDFPAVVTMDSHGVSLHQQMLEQSSARLADLLAR